MEKLYIVGDTNGVYLCLGEQNNKVTSDIQKAVKFTTFGAAMEQCILYNKNAYTFRVIPYNED